MNTDNLSDLGEDTQELNRVELPTFEYDLDEESKMRAFAETIEKLPLDEQEEYWQIMDNENLEFNEKAALINDLLERFNGDSLE